VIREGGRCFESKKTKRQFESIREILAEQNEDALLADGYEDALIGVANSFGIEARAAYDYETVIGIMIKRDRMTREDAEEHFSFNVIGSGVPHAPIFVTHLRG